MDIHIDYNPKTTRGVLLLHCGISISIKKLFKAKQELWKLKYFMMQKI